MQDSNLIGPVIVAIGVILAAIAFAVVGTFLQTADTGTQLQITRLEEAIAAGTKEQQSLAAQVVILKSDLAKIRDDLSLIANRVPVVNTAQTDGLTGTSAPGPDALAENFDIPPETEALTEQMRIARDRFNKGITQPDNKIMMEILGPPRDQYSNECQPITNAKLKALIEERKVGPITVTMLRPALDSLAKVFAHLKQTDPDVYAKVGTAGAVCARFIRGSSTAVSNHAWGTAIDLTLEGKLDPFADGGTQFGLLLLAEYFNDEGWYWGAGYNREDSMHFEVGAETLTRWASEGKL